MADTGAKTHIFQKYKKGPLGTPNELAHAKKLRIWTDQTKRAPLLRTKAKKAKFEKVVLKNVPKVTCVKYLSHRMNRKKRQTITTTTDRQTQTSDELH